MTSTFRLFRRGAVHAHHIQGRFRPDPTTRYTGVQTDVDARCHEAAIRTGVASVSAGHGTRPRYRGVGRRSLGDRHLFSSRGAVRPLLLVDLPADVAADGGGPRDL